MPTRAAGPRDFGAVRRIGMAHVMGAVVVVTAAAGFITFDFLRDRHANMATAQAWEISGPPCPQITAAEWAAKHYLAQDVFDYDGITIGRRAGHVSCSDVKQHGGRGLFIDRVCQFTSPAVLSVTSDKGAYYFVPGPGQLASLIIHDGVPKCVLASHYTLQSPD